MNLSVYVTESGAVTQRVIKGHIKSHHSKYYDMIALRQGNENAQNNMIASFSFASQGKCNSMFKSVGSLLRMEAFLPNNYLNEEGLDRFRLNDQI